MLGATGFVSFLQEGRKARRKSVSVDWSDVLDSGPFCILVWAQDAHSGSPIRATSNIEELTGWPARDFLSGASIYPELIDEDDAASVESWRSAQSAGNHTECAAINYRIINRSGQVRHVAERQRQVSGGTGKDRFLASYIEDVTELHDRENERFNREVALASVMVDEAIDAMAQGMLIHDEDTIHKSSSGLAEMLDIPAGLVAPGASLREFVRFILARGDEGKGVDVEASLSDSDKLCADGKSFSTERVLPDGRVLAVEIHPRASGGMVSTYTDVTQDREREADLERLIGRIADVSVAVKSAMHKIHSGMSDLSSRTEHQASSLEETSASIEQLGATVRQNSANADDAIKIAAMARETAVAGGSIVEQAGLAMGQIEESSKKIEDIVEVLHDISMQTNLLAINASVEAARAGQAGLGFAVVASEVRALSQRAAGASKDIRELIADSGTQVSDGSRLVNEAGVVLSENVASAKKVVEKMSEIAMACQEQAIGIDQISQTASSLDRLTQQNAQLVEVTSTDVEDAVKQLDLLQRQVGKPIDAPVNPDNQIRAADAEKAQAWRDQLKQTG